MISFWILAAGLTALALLFVLVPLVSRRPVARGIAQDDLNLALFRQQLAELDGDLAAGNLDQAQYDAARRDLERELLSDVEDQPGDDRRHRQGGRWLAAVLALAVPLGTIGLYLKLGATDIIPRLQDAGTMAQQGAGTVHGGTAGELPPLDVLVQRLAARMQEHPEDAEGWLMLGRTYLAIDKPDQAVEAFARAYQLTPDNPDLLLAYAQGLAAVNEGRLEGRPAELIGQALAKDPTHIEAHWLDGMLDYQRGRYAAAVTKWEGVLSQLDPSGDEAGELRRFIDEARRRAEETGSATAAGPAQQATAAATPSATPGAAAASSTSDRGTAGEAGTVTVTVGLAEPLWYQAAAEDTLFVFAKAVSGPPMPLAVKRLQVKDLPTTVTLDDSLAMTPNQRLSSAPQVLVAARISKSGLATPQSGDLEGEAGPVTPGDGTTLSLVIDRQRP